MLCLDTSHFLYLTDEHAEPPRGLDGNPVPDCGKRLGYLVACAQRDRTQLVLPTPIITESLVRRGADAARFLVELKKFSVFRMADFDQRAALECALLMQQHWHGRLAELREQVSRHRVKFDLQIIAICKVAGATTLLTDDSRIAKVADAVGLNCIGVEDLPLPPEEPQGRFHGI